MSESKRKSSTRGSASSAKGRSPSQDHVCLQRGVSHAELKALERTEMEKIAPFAFEDSPKPLKKCVGLVPDASTVELNNKNRSVAPFNYGEE